MTDDAPARTCESTRYARGACTDDGPRWEVVTWTRARDTDPWKVGLRHPACFRHGIAEVEGFASIAGSARCELVDPADPRLQDQTP